VGSSHDDVVCSCTPTKAAATTTLPHQTLHHSTATVATHIPAADMSCGTTPPRGKEKRGRVGKNGGAKQTCNHNAPRSSTKYTVYIQHSWVCRGRVLRGEIAVRGGENEAQKDREKKRKIETRTKGQEYPGWYVATHAARGAAEVRHAPTMLRLHELVVPRVRTYLPFHSPYPRNCPSSSPL